MLANVTIGLGFHTIHKCLVCSITHVPATAFKLFFQAGALLQANECSLLNTLR